MSLIAVFPGQGSQQVGMLSDFAEAEIVKACFAEASDVLGADLWALIQSDDGRLNQTEYTQPALLTASTALFRLWRDQQAEAPAYMAGHSLGEYSALVCAGALQLADAVGLVNSRGRLMQQAVPAGVGAMAAVIGLDDEGVQALCDALAGDDVLAPVNFNSPGQVVVAGHAAAVERAIAEGKAHGARMVKKLPVSVPSHCELMRAAAEKFANHLAAVAMQDPDVPVIQNVNAAPQDSAAAIREALLAQLYSPVRWVGSMEYALGQGVTRAVEFGPGAVLQGLNKRIKKDWPQAGTATQEQFALAVAAA